MHERATGKHGFTRFTMARTWRKPPLPPYSIICAWPHGLHPNVILSQDSQVRSPKIPEIGTLMTLEAHKVLCKPLIEVRFNTKL